MTVLVDFEQLTADFERKLITQLRGHGAESEYLETWVPDEDPVKSMLNMVDSALSSGCEEFAVRFAQTTMDEGQRAALLGSLEAFGAPRLDAESAGYVLRVRAKSPK